MPKKKTVSQHLGNGRGAFRKALLSVLLEKHSEQDALDVAIKEFGNRCVYCGDKNAFLQTDLLWPASIGGVTVAGNVVPACPSCNSERGAKNWHEYISTSKRVTSKKSTDEIEKQIEEIQNYMRKYNGDKKPDLDAVLTQEEMALIRNFNLLLDALSQGIRTKLGNPQEKEIKFRDCSAMFDDLLKTAQKHLI